MNRFLCTFANSSYQKLGQMQFFPQFEKEDISLSINKIRANKKESDN